KPCFDILPSRACCPHRHSSRREHVLARIGARPAPRHGNFGDRTACGKASRVVANARSAERKSSPDKTSSLVDRRGRSNGGIPAPAGPPAASNSTGRRLMSIDAPSAAENSQPAAARAGGSSFYFAMRIMPKEQREAMFEIYSFCKLVDDIADGD